MSDSRTTFLSPTLRTILCVVPALAIFYLLVLRTGTAFVLSGYSPDSCWLLKLGQIITVHCYVPVSDLLTFTQKIGAAPPYVIYQWLSEVVFYLLMSLCKPAGLLVIAGGMATVSFLLVPLRACARMSVSSLWLVLTLSMLLATANLRSFVRPELFTYLFLCWFLKILQDVRRSRMDAGASKTIQVGVVLKLTAIMILWTNMHSGFVCGVLLLLLYSIFISWADFKDDNKNLGTASRTLLTSSGTCLIATLVNPYGVGLWAYLPHLFFASINSQVTELSSFSVADMRQFVYFPSFVLVGLCVGATVCFLVKQRRTNPGIAFEPEKLLSLLIMILCGCLLFLVKRLLALSSLILVFETVNFRGTTRPSSRSLAASLCQRKLSYLFLEAIMIFCLMPVAVVNSAAAVRPITIPCQSAGFRPPFEALDFFAKKYSSGRIFAVARIADMLEFYIGPPYSIFMDTRLDIYSDEIFNQYHALISADSTWPEILKMHKIDWVFIIPDNPLCKVISRDPEWEPIWQDAYSAIFRRKTAAAQQLF